MPPTRSQLARRRRLIVGCLLFLSTAASAASQPVLLSGTVTYDKDAVIGELGPDGAHLTDVVIQAGTRIQVTRGHSLKLQARTLTIQGKGRITIDGKGDPGLPGAAQTTELPPWTSGGSGDPHAEWMAAGSEADRGLPGAPGGQGEQGAHVELIADELRAPEQIAPGQMNLERFRALFDVNVEGGEGGPGGQGGPGRLLICGENPQHQKRGPDGFSGPVGPRGPNGSFALQGQPEPAPVGIALTISGGISLGAYEAGYNWALVRYIKSRSAAHRRPKDPPPLSLVGVTGASAGSINTLLTAITWCQTDETDRQEQPFKNAFFNAWWKVGLPRLLPEDPTRYEAHDAVLSRQAFVEVEEALARRVADKASYTPDSCILPIGFTVTRREPIKIRGTSLQAPVDRFSIALEARTTARGLEFYDLKPSDERPYAKPYLHIAPDESAVDFARVRKVLRASSAFPMAFGMEQVTHYDRRGGSATPVTDWFWDGGLYDNIPIGLALGLIEEPLYGRPRFPGTIQLLALDPDHRRIPLQEPGAVAPPEHSPRRGLSNLPRIAGNLYSVAHKYELQNFLRFALPQLNNCKAQGGQAPATGPDTDTACINEPLVTSRYSPIYGELFNSFGAFILEAFRRFDFAAGIYDSLYTSSDLECDTARPRADGGKASQAGCMVQTFHRIYGELGIDSDPDAAYVVKTLFKKELAQQFRISPDEEQRTLQGIALPGQSAARWLQAAPRHKYFEVLLTQADEPVDLEKEDLQADLELTEKVMKALNELPIRAGLPAEDRPIVAEGELWLRDPMLRLVRRAHLVEVQDDYPLGRQVTGTASLLVGTQLANSRVGLDLDPSSIPKDHMGLAEMAFHFLPYQIAGSIRTLQVGWRPTLGATPRLAFGLPLTASMYYGQAPFGFAAHVGLSAIIRPPWTFLSAIELGPRVTTSTTARGYTEGAELALYLLAGKLRLGAAVDTFQGFTWGNSVFLTAGFADVNGMLYHALF